MWVEVLLGMLLGPFVPAMFAFVCVLKFLNVKGDRYARFERYGTEAPGPIAAYPWWGPYFLFLNVGELLVYKHDVEPSSAFRTVSEGLHQRSALST